MALIFTASTKYLVKYIDDKGNILENYASGLSRDEIAKRIDEKGYFLLSMGEDESNI